MNVIKLRKKNLLVAALAVLMTALMFVSCSPAEMQKADNDTISLYFGHLEAKAVNETAYDVSTSHEFTSSSVTVGDAGNYYWSYTAVKKDNLFKEGEKTSQTACATGTGLGGTRTFSKGKWLITLYAYASSEDRTAGKQWLFSGSNASTTKNNQNTVITSNQTIDIPVSYSYIAGTGSVTFDISTTVKHNDTLSTGAYKVTKVEAVLGGTTVNLTGTNNTSWAATTSCASGDKTVELKVYVDNETTPRLTTSGFGTAYVLHGLTTTVKGSATITFTGSKVNLTFTPSMPTTQPDSTKFSTT